MEKLNQDWREPIYDFDPTLLLDFDPRSIEPDYRGYCDFPRSAPHLAEESSDE